MTALKYSPLDDRHRALGARMGAFGGWEMPISYAGTITEHTAVRQRAGVFDVSHLGKLLVRGDGAREDLDRALTNRVADLEPGQARYSLILNDDAGIIDDLIVYVLAPDRVLVVPNAANVDLVRDRVASVGAKVEPLDWATPALQGPRARAILNAVFPKAPALPYLGVAELDDGIVIARTGYTGEHG
ncbi:MAG: glycine cleavage system protein T, partial [Actinomycetota bacterium]